MPLIEPGGVGGSGGGAGACIRQIVGRNGESAKGRWRGLLREQGQSRLYSTGSTKRAPADDGLNDAGACLRTQPVYRDVKHLSSQPLKC